ncbi:hypothetical protein [Winogradskyella sp.]|uniref:hypothetical protein n=1 Tax=Winogradskyella sp. TaxID=1883156 RepID=UPI0025F73ACA|nr:hypothetical protein [Winogradskyella sp.]MBT8243943.1 hypothetical protein [Winogradskyella sp.]
MKKISLILFLQTFAQNTEDVTEASDDTGTICFISSTGLVGSASTFKVFIDKTFVYKYNNKRYSNHEVSAGKHLVFVQFGGKKSKERAEKFEVEVQPGKITYVQVVFENNTFVNNVYCEEVTANITDQKMKKLKLYKKCL